VNRVIAAGVPVVLVVMALLLAACGGSTGSFSRAAFYDVKGGDSEQQVRAAVGTPEAVLSKSDDPALDVGEESWLWVEGGTLYRIHFDAAGEVRFTSYGPCVLRFHTESLCGGT
jgi:hypothetical protein